ncbi:MAG: bile acid:sodium symporter family protein [Pseudonocardiaceae bacterium]
MLNAVTGTLLPAALFAMMLGLGSSVTIADFILAWRQPRALVLGAISGVVLVPSLVFVVLGTLALPADLTLGLLMVATCPGGLFSNYLTSLARGHVALSISLTAVGSIAYVFTLPLWVGVGLQSFSGQSDALDVPLERIFLPLVSFLLVPVATGLLLRSKRPSLVERYGKRVRDLGAISAILCYFAIVYEQRGTLLATVSAALPLVVIFNLAALLLVVALALICRLTRREIITLAIEHVIRQEGTAIYVAVVLLSRTAASLPLLVNTLVGLLLGLQLVVAARQWWIGPETP